MKTTEEVRKFFVCDCYGHGIYIFIDKKYKYKNNKKNRSIAGQVKGWAGNWDAVYDNIILRGKIKQEIVETARKLKMPELMEAKFNSLTNDAFHRISDEITKEIGLPESERVFPEWRTWVLKEAKKMGK